MMPLFLNPLFLGGLAALSVPVIVHLLKSRRFEMRQLGTIRFLMQAEKEISRRRKLKNLLLFLCRLLVVALIVLIFARPLSPGGVENEVMLFIDASGSMNGETASIKRFELAVSRAQEILENQAGNSKVRLFLFSDDVKEINSLDDADIFPRGYADYSAVFKFAAVEFSQSELSRKKMYVITDLQKASLPDQPLNLFPVDVDVRLINVGNWKDVNFAVTGVRNLAEFAGNPGIVEVKFRAFGPIDSNTRLNIELFINDQKPPLSVQVSAIESRVRFNWTPEKSGQYRGYAKIVEADSFPVDNKRDFVFNVREPDKVLIVNGEASQNRYQAPGYFVQKVLETSKGDGLQSGFSVKTDIRVRNLDKYAIVALCDIKELFKSEIKALKKFTRNGGGLLFFLGGNTDVQVLDDLVNEGLFPGKLKLRRPAIPSAFETWDVNDTIFAAFAESDKGALKRFIFRSAFDIDPTPEARVICRLSNGAPAIVVRKNDKNRIVVVTNPGDRSWSDWPIEKAFVPFIRSLFDSFLVDQKRPLSHPESALTISHSDQPGVYDSPLKVLVPNSAESEVGSVDEATFRQKLGLLEEDSREQKQEITANENELWPTLLLTLLFLLPLENLLADRSIT